MKTEDRDHIIHKYYDPDKPHNGYSRFSYLGYDYDASTGMTDQELRAGVAALAARQPRDMPHFLAKAEALAFVLDNTRIDVNDFDWYVGIYSWGRVIAKSYPSRWMHEIFRDEIPEISQLMEDLHKSGLCDSWLDYDHAVPDWDAIMTLGFPGLLERIRRYRHSHESKGALSTEQTAFFDALELTYEAILRLLARMKAYADTKKGEKIPKIKNCLETLMSGAPSDTYEALQMMYLYFMFSESIDCYQVRSLGNGFDRIIEPYYRHDLETGHATQKELDDYLAYFLLQFYAIGNYWGQPLFMGGTKDDGTTKYTPFAKRVLEIYDELDIHNPKIQLLWGESTPQDIRWQVYDMIRRGKYMTLVCEDGARKAVKAGYDCSEKEARDFIVSGCYEPLVRGGTLIENGYPNLVKLVSLAMRDGVDPMTQLQIGPHTGTSFATFEEFFTAFETQFSTLFETLRRITNTSERFLSAINPGLLLSSTKDESLQRMEDGYTMADPKATTLFELNAFASCVDALLAVKHLVFDTQSITMDRFVQVLDANWSGYEDLHHKVLTECPKYGNANEQAEVMARRVSLLIPKYILVHRNLRGARFVVEYHGAMEYAWQGERTEATPDGRFAKAELSKNASPTVGADVGGATSFILSCTSAISAEYAPGGFNADVMLHPTTLKGEDGLRALDALVEVYRKRGGIDIQFNVMSAETLRDAQKHPEKYKNLQVRVSGWNALWNEIPPILQESYIHRAETVTGR